MLINELSKKTGVAIATLRYYENFGLFKGALNDKVKTNNYKDYDDTIVEKMAFIKGAKEVGFTLAEIKGFLDSWYNKRLSAEKKITIVQNKIEEIEAKVVQLNGMKKMLHNALKEIQTGNC